MKKVEHTVCRVKFRKGCESINKTLFRETKMAKTLQVLDQDIFVSSQLHPKSLTSLAANDTL